MNRHTVDSDSAPAVNPGLSSPAMLDVALRLRRGDFTLEVTETLPGHGVTALFGPSGSGKSTLLRAVAGLEPAARGHVRLGAQCWQDDASGLFLPPQKRRVGLVFQRPNLFPHLSVAGNLRYARRRAAPGVNRVDAASVLHWLDLQPLMTRPIQTLSGGEQQRVAIARALLSQPELLLLDEPLSGVDVGRRRHILPFLERLHQELQIPVLLVSHQVEEVARLADRVLLIQHGRIVDQGDIFAMLQPMTGEETEPFVLLPGRIREHDSTDHLTAVGTPAGELWVPGDAGPAGRALRLVVKATDVSLSAQPLTEVSILNQLPATILKLDPRAQDQLVTLEAGGVKLLARVSHRAVHRMMLVPGSRVYAMVKSVSVLTAGEPP